MRVKPIFVAISLFFPTALLFAKNLEQEKILEVNTQQYPPSASYEKNPSVATTEALLLQSHSGSADKYLLESIVLLKS